MGCWNQTCMLTHTPILRNEPIKLIVLRENFLDSQIMNGQCMPTDCWEPICPPLTGEYNEYGSIKNIKEDIGYRRFNIYLKLFHKKYTVEKFFDLHISEFEKILYKDKKKYAYTLIPTKIYNYVTDKFGAMKYNGKTFYELSKDGARFDLDVDIMSRGFNNTKKIVEQITSFGKVQDKQEDLSNFYNEYYSRSAEDKDDMARFSLFCSLLHRLRTPFIPQSGQGGQDAHYKEYKIREKATALYLKHLKNLTKELYE